MTRINGNRTNVTLERICRLAATSASVVALFASLGFATSALGKEKEFKFTNNTGVLANDLHIEFNKGSLEVTGTTPNDALPVDDSDDSRSTVNFRQGLSGKGVKNGDSIIIKFKYSGTDPKVKQAWWTNGNTLTPAGNHKSGQKGTGDYIPNGELPATDITCAWRGDGAAGDGQYLVMIDAQPREFVTFPGDTMESVSARFAQFIEEWQYGSVLAQAPGMVQCTGDSYFTDLPNIQIDILQQDSRMQMMCDPCELDLEVYNLVAGERAEFVVNDHHEGATVAIVYGLKQGSTQVDGLFGYCATFGLQGITPNNLIGQGPIVGGQYSKSLLLPPNTAGLELHLQAVMRDTCPSSCESKVWTGVIQK